MTQSYGDGGNITVKLGGPYAGAGVSGSMDKILNVTLLESEWKGGESPFSQRVNIPVSVNTMVNLQPSVLQMEQFGNRCILVAENNGGEVTVFAIGEKPEGDVTIQATTTEVIA